MTEHGSGPAAGRPRPARPGLDRRAAEQLLRRDPAAHRHAPELAALLTAAAAPGRGEELAGRSAAVAAFRDGQHHASVIPGHRRRRSARSRLARLLTLKAAVGLAVATGGVALAAATGALPGSPRLAAPAPGSHAPAVTSSPTDERNENTPSPQSATTTASPQTSCPAGSPTGEPGGTGQAGQNGQTPKPPTGGPTGRPGQPPFGPPEIKLAGCAQPVPSVIPSAAASNSPPPFGQPPAGGSAPAGGSGDCREACPPPGGGDRQRPPSYPPPAG